MVFSGSSSNGCGVDYLPAVAAASYQFTILRRRKIWGSRIRAAQLDALPFLRQLTSVWEETESNDGAEHLIYCSLVCGPFWWVSK